MIRQCGISNLFRSNIHLKLYGISIEFSCSQTIHFTSVVISSCLSLSLFTIQIVYFYFINSIIMLIAFFFFRMYSFMLVQVAKCRVPLSSQTIECFSQLRFILICSN